MKQVEPTDTQTETLRIIRDGQLVLIFMKQKEPFSPPRTMVQYDGTI